ncbi:hypothetical protein V1499_07415 [Neobacillus sp. SCS-31]|uniref:hypothetical protein n=1 Tax=Neobacillus oceani TaxID=3115292 RepID=UPI003906A079
MEERLERMETMLGQLVGMVGNVIAEQLKMRQESNGLRQDFESEKQKNAERHEEILGKFKAMELDRDFI